MSNTFFNTPFIIDSDSACSSVDIDAIVVSPLWAVAVLDHLPLTRYVEQDNIAVQILKRPKPSVSLLAGSDNKLLSHAENRADFARKQAENRITVVVRPTAEIKTYPTWLLPKPYTAINRYPALFKFKSLNLANFPTVRFGIENYCWLIHVAGGGKGKAIPSNPEISAARKIYEHLLAVAGEIQISSGFCFVAEIKGWMSSRVIMAKLTKQAPSGLFEGTIESMYEVPRYPGWAALERRPRGMLERRVSHDETQIGQFKLI